MSQKTQSQGSQPRILHPGEERVCGASGCVQVVKKAKGVWKGIDPTPLLLIDSGGRQGRRQPLFWVNLRCDAGVSTLFRAAPYRSLQI